MAGSIAITKPQPRLIDPAESQRPLTFYAEVLRRHAFMIILLSILFTALVILACALLPPQQYRLRNHCHRPPGSP